MKNKKYLYSLIYFILSLLIYLLIITTLAHFNLVTYKTVSIISFVFIIALFMFSGFYVGKSSETKGYLKGTIIGIINILLILLLSFLFKTNIESKILIYFLELLLSSALGAMIGINLKK